MYLKPFTVFACFLICHCLVKKDKDQDQCGLLKQHLEASTVSVELNKRGFHKELINMVKLSPHTSKDVKFLLVHRWPSGIYLDPYELAAGRDQRQWQILFDSAIDLEKPAHKSSGFVTYVYPADTGPTPTRLQVKIPLHGRYQKPSNDGNKFATIYIEHPELLLHSEKCVNLDLLKPHAVIDAPCTVNNSSSCSWVKVSHQQDRETLSFQLPVGDGSAVVYVCAGTLLVTMVCCIVLSRYMWKYKIV